MGNEEHIADGLKDIPATQQDIAHIKSSLYDIRAEMQKIVSLIEKTTDHEERIRDLEKSKNFLWGAIGLAAVFMPVITAIILKAIGINN